MKNSEFTITDDLLASKWQRFLNGILDLLMVHIILGSIGTTVMIIGDVSNNYELSNWVESTTTYEKVLFWLVALFLYYYLTETYFSRTFAKYFTKTIVITKEGLKPGRKSILMRTLCRFIPLEGLTFLEPISGVYTIFFRIPTWSENTNSTIKKERLHFLDEIIKEKNT